MIPEKRISTHPGEILLEDFLRPMGVSQVRLAQHIGVPVQRINEIVNRKRGITPETAWLLAETFGTSAEFWFNAQAMYDLTANRPARHVRRLVAA